MSLPNLLIVCPGSLFPQDMASKVRILNIIKAAKDKFDITFLANCESQYVTENTDRLESICSQVLLLPFRNKKNLRSRILHRIYAELLHHTAGVPSDLYYSGMTNLSSVVVNAAVGNRQFDIALFEYWFSSSSVRHFKNRGIPCILDMHDILWQKKATSVKTDATSDFSKRYTDFLNRRYRLFEESAWKQFDGIISINNNEHSYVCTKVHNAVPVINAGMGVDIHQWPYCWNPANPPYLVFYGSLSSVQNQQAAMRCINKIMPLVWEKFSNARLWIVGANPPENLRKLQNNSRIKVTGFIEDVKNVLSQATLLVCPLVGKYGFRSRLIEAMALGLPVVASADAVYGMNLDNNQGLITSDNDGGMADAATKLLASPIFAKQQSLLAHKQVEQKFSFEATYGRIVSFLLSFVTTKA